MTGKPKSDNEALDRLADALVEDILAASDQDILADAKADNEDPAAIATHMRALFERAAASAGKARLAAAKTAVARDRHRPASVIPLDPSLARRRLEQILAEHPETARKLTIAARKGEGLSDSDVIGMLEDLEELGVISSSGPTDEDV